MNLQWKVVYYRTSHGTYPARDFIDGLDPRAKSKVIYVLDLLEQFGISVGLPYSKKLAGTELWELRVVGADSIRILYVAVTGKSFLILHGFLKKKMRVDRKEVRVAEDRLRDFRQRSVL